LDVEVDFDRLIDDADLYEEIDLGDDDHFVDLRETKLRSTQLLLAAMVDDDKYVPALFYLVGGI
jgi:hypothetical protein